MFWKAKDISRMLVVISDDDTDDGNDGTDNDTNDDGTENEWS